MADKLAGKVAVVTGAASGIGAAAAGLFAAEGASVVLADIDVDAGRQLALELPEASFIQTDVTQEEQVAAAVQHALDQYGRIDCMLNNAGRTASIGSIRTIPGDDWLWSLDLLLNSVFYGMKHAARAMLSQRSGCILNTASIAGISAGLGPHAYTTAKAAVIALTESVACELASSGIRCNAVAPGTVPTALMVRSQGTYEKAVERSMNASPLGVPIRPCDVAKALLFLASDDGSNVSGHTLTVDGGVTAFRTLADHFFVDSAFRR